MKSPKSKSTIDVTASTLRELVQSVGPGSLLGSEEELVAKLQVSRATLRQVARLLEREGWLVVKRGISGGYFSARPDLLDIENSMGAYLDMVEADVREAAVIGIVLWVEILKRAAVTRSERTRVVLQELRGKVKALDMQAAMGEVLRLELEIRSAILGISNSRYIELLFQINTIYARRRLATRPIDLVDAAEHEAFMQGWQQAKMMEFAAIEDGDTELAVLAAHHSRNVWYRRWRDIEKD